MNDPVRKMVQFDPRLLSVLKQISKGTGLDPDQVVNLALYNLGTSLGHIKVVAQKISAPDGVDFLDEVEPAPPPKKASPARKPRQAPKPARPKKKARPARDVLYIQVDEGAISPLRKDVYLIGRGSKCDFVIQHRSVSREHAVITRERSGWFIEDLNSANGTWLEGEQIGKHKLLGGEEITISNHRLRLDIRAG